jgi:hypothetical protein
MSKQKYTKSQLQAHRALLHAAAQVGSMNYKRGVYVCKSKIPYSITSVHQLLVQYSSDVLKGIISVNDAIAFCTHYEVMKERF